MLRLIVNADDFGLTESVNHGIAHAHQNGILTSTSIIACGNAFEHAIELQQHLPNLSIGAHLTLVEEVPAARPEQIPSLLSSNNRLRSGAASFTTAYMLRQIDLREIAIELEAQINKIKSAGVSISHIDGHQHLHMLPGINRIVASIAKKHDIHIIRIPYEIPKWYMLTNIAKLPRFVALLILNCFCRMNSLPHLIRSDYFAGFFHSGNLSYHNLKMILSHLPSNGTCELICHPGRNDPNTPYLHWNYNWSKELHAITHPNIKRIIKNKNIKLISTRDQNQTNLIK